MSPPYDGLCDKQQFVALLSKAEKHIKICQQPNELQRFHWGKNCILPRG